MNVDLIGQGGATGEVAGVLMADGRLNANAMKPFLDFDEKGQLRPYITVFNGGDAKNPDNYSTKLVNNATLRRDEWKRLDDAVITISESRLGGVQDLVSICRKAARGDVRDPRRAG